MKENFDSDDAITWKGKVLVHLDLLWANELILVPNTNKRLQKQLNN